jgi:hypothetical protein
MRIWLGSEEVEEFANEEDWPTARSRQAWLQFYEGERKADRSKWKREIQSARVKWTATPPAEGTHVVVEPVPGANAAVLTPTFERLGELKVAMRGARRDVVSARVGANFETVDLEYFGPRALR